MCDCNINAEEKCKWVMCSLTACVCFPAVTQAVYCTAAGTVVPARQWWWQLCLSQVSSCIYNKWHILVFLETTYCTRAGAENSNTAIRIDADNSNKCCCENTCCREKNHSKWNLFFSEVIPSPSVWAHFLCVVVETSGVQLVDASKPQGERWKEFFL